MALICDICGGPLSGQADGQFQCTQCGMTYSLEYIREKFQNQSQQSAAAQVPSGDLPGKTCAGFEDLEKENYDQAEQLFRKLLQMDPEDGEASLGLLMAQCRIPDFRGMELAIARDYSDSIVSDPRYLKAKANAGSELKQTMESWESRRSEEMESFQKDHDRRRNDALLEIRRNMDKINGINEEMTRLKQSRQREGEELENSLASMIAEHRTALRSGANQAAYEAAEERIAALSREIAGLKLFSLGKKDELTRKIEEEEEKRKTALKDIQAEQAAQTEAQQKLRKRIDGLKDQTERELSAMDGKKKWILDDLELPFGFYRSDKNHQMQSIVWKVLDCEDNRLLLMSKYGLDVQPYHDKALSNDRREDITWETCSLRSWLNNTFYREAFTEAERKRILLTSVEADKNPEYNTDPGENTRDYVFLLSAKEVETYLPSEDDRECRPTEYAVDRGVYFEDGNCWWWLRTPGYFPDLAVNVFTDGSVNNYGSRIDYCNDAVRPVLWIEV